MSLPAPKKASTAKAEPEGAAVRSNLT